jgi:aspartate-semialdehyde dehydrogenase
MSKTINLAIVGATGVVGQTMLACLQENNFPVGELHLVASSRSAGTQIDFNGKAITVEALDTFDFSKVQIALFSAGGERALQYAPIAAAAGCVVIDNSSAFRRDPEIPLVIPEVNAHVLKDYRKRMIIANPNCSTMQMLVALKPIYDAVGITRINVATYQSVSGSGKAAIDELKQQTRAWLEQQPAVNKVYPVPIAFNLIPHIDTFEENGYTKEEMKMVNETRKILEDENIQVNPTAVRVPVFYGHSEAINIETRKKISAAEVRELLKHAPGVEVLDGLAPGQYPTPAIHAEGTNPVYVGRIREDISHPNGINLWVVADNIRKGAALNTVQIAEYLLQHYLD